MPLGGMAGLIRHNCGLVVAHSLHDVYSMLCDLQHRGREAAGIAAIGDTIDVLKWVGPVNTFDLEDLYSMFPSSKYHTYMAHVRYATRGRKEEILEDAHPHTIGGTTTHCGNHVIIRDCDAAGVHNGQIDPHYLSSIDAAVLQTGCDTEALLHYYLQHGELQLLKNIPGAYTLAIADKKKKAVIVMRDRTGIKPGVLGTKDGKCIITSEDIALRKNGGRFVEDLDPGSVYYLSPEGDFERKKVVLEQLAHCFFEWNYLANPESHLNGLTVQKLRETLGEAVAQEFRVRVSDPNSPMHAFHPDHVELVSYLPRSPSDAARKFARTLDLPSEKIFYKRRAERSFQGSTKKERRKSIDENLFLLPGAGKRLAGKTVIVLDDSMVRGNNVARARHLLYNRAKVKSALYVLYTPMIGITDDNDVDRGCEWGVDMPPDDDFIARGRNEEEIAKAIKMPVMYLSLEGMLDAFAKSGQPADNLCHYCIGGKRPF